MTRSVSAALFQALSLARAPRGPRPGPEERLPDGITQLIRIAAGEEGATSSARAATGVGVEALREAAIFYIQQVLFAPGSSSYRILGADADAPDELLREHYRWLARWLHPDRTPDPWEVVFAERVNRAWQDLRTSERRARYQPTHEEGDEWAAVVAAPPAEVLSSRQLKPPRVARSRDLRWIPSAVLATLGSVAIGLIVLYYASQRQMPPGPRIVAAQGEAAPDQSETAVAVPPVRAPVPVADLAAPARQQPEVAAAEQPTLPTVETPTPPIAALAPIPSMPQEPRADRRPKPAPAPAPVRPAAPAIAAVADRPPARSAARMPATERVVSVAATRMAATEVSEPAQTDAGARATSRDANRLLGQFSRAYEDGDLQGMRELFASDARGPKGGVNSIIADYRRVFAASSERSLSVRNVSWFVDGETFTIIASFEASVTGAHESHARHTRGDLRLDLRREGDRWQIYRMQHGERPG
jgi:hypothetical protein